MVKSFLLPPKFDSLTLLLTNGCKFTERELATLTRNQQGLLRDSPESDTDRAKRSLTLPRATSLPAASSARPTGETLVVASLRLLDIILLEIQRPDPLAWPPPRSLVRQQSASSRGIATASGAAEQGMAGGAMTGGTSLDIGGETR